jgi:hypothetical protein
MTLDITVDFDTIVSFVWISLVMSPQAMWRKKPLGF